MGDYQIIIYNSSGGTLTFDDDSNATRCKDRLLEHDVNHPAKLTFTLENRRATAADNLLSSSYAGWSTGNPEALALGMVVRYYVSATDYTTGVPGALTLYFAGPITALKPRHDGSLTVVAHDWSISLEKHAPEMAFFESYRDRLSLDVGLISSGPYAYKLAIEGVDSNGHYPGVEIALLSDDQFFDFGTDIEGGGSLGGPDLTEGNAWAQSFIAEDQEVLGVLFRGDYDEDVSATEHSVLRVSIRDDDGADRPETTDLVYVDYELTSTGSQWVWVYFDSTDHTFTRLIPGRKYWVHIEHYSTDETYPGYWQFHIGSSHYLSDQADAHFVYGSVPLDSGSSEFSDATFFAFPMLARVYPIPPTDYTYYLDGATPKLVITKLRGPYPGLHDAPTVLTGISTTITSADRGRVSYYYDTTPLSTVLGDLIKCEPVNNLAGSVDAGLSVEIPVYKTMDKTIGECVRELCDLYGYYDAPDYSQSAIDTRLDGAYQYVIDRRKNTADDTPTMTFAHGADTSTDNHRRIIRSNLDRRSTGIPGAVRVVGRTPEGGSIIVERDGCNVGTGNWVDGVKFRARKTVHDSTITTLEAANRRAWAELDKYGRDTWEGTIEVDGVYPQLMQVTGACGGDIIAITDSRLGLSAERFAVTGISAGRHRTTIRVTNADFFADNLIRDAIATASSSASFLSGADDMTYIYRYLDRASTEAATTLYMQLSKAYNTILDSHSNYAPHRVLCTRLAQPSGGTDYDTVVYRAEFAPENGYGLIDRVDLYTAETGGTPSHTYYFTTIIDPAATPYKSKSTRVVVDFALQPA